MKWRELLNEPKITIERRKDRTLAQLMLLARIPCRIVGTYPLEVIRGPHGNRGIR